MGKQLAVTVVSTLLLLPACGAPATTATGFGSSWATGNVDGVSYEVRGKGGTSSSTAGGDHHEFVAGENKIRVQGDRIVVNGQERGTVKRGDSVLLDADGTLTVNGEKR